MGTRERLIRTAALTLVAMATLAACAPDPGTPPGTTVPPTSLPTAPRVAVPSSLPAGTRLLVDHGPPTTPDSPWDFYLVDDDSAELLDPESYDRLELLAAFGRLAPDGRALVTAEERPDLGLDATGTALCPTAEAVTCQDLGDIGTSSFSPDGSKVSAVLHDSASDTHWLTLLDATSLEEITRAPVTANSPVLRAPWSPDSSAIALTIRDDPGDRRSPTSLAVLEATPGAVPQVILAGSALRWVDSALGWSDDGWISYYWVDPGATDGATVSMRAMPADESQPSELLRPHLPLGGVVPLPDGSVIGQVVGSTVPQLLRRGLPPVPLAVADVIVAEYGTVPSQTQVFGYLPPD